MFGCLSERAGSLQLCLDALASVHEASNHVWLPVRCLAKPPNMFGCLSERAGSIQTFLVALANVQEASNHGWMP
jgi:hypothetical protein